MDLRGLTQPPKNSKIIFERIWYLKTNYQPLSIELVDL
jgi:hypothetical protein